MRSELHMMATAPSDHPVAAWTAELRAREERLLIGYAPAFVAVLGVLQDDLDSVVGKHVAVFPCPPGRTPAVIGLRIVAVDYLNQQPGGLGVVQQNADLVARVGHTVLTSNCRASASL